MRTDDSLCAEWFEVTDRLRQGLVLYPLLFNIFANVLLSSPQMTAIEPTRADVLGNLVHLHEQPANIASDRALKRRRRAVCVGCYTSMTHASFRGRRVDRS